MVRVAEGAVDAFAALYDVTAPRIFGLAHRVLRDRAMAEEITREVMLELWRTATRYDPDKAQLSAASSGSAGKV